jgi:hypothetical protein
MDLMLQVPHSIQEYCWLKEANKMSRQGLVRWTNSDLAAVTWENLEDLHRRFPDAPAWAPKQVLESRWSNHPSLPRRQVKVAWNYTTPNKSTWEDFEALKHKFPAIASWGQAKIEGKGIVSNTPIADSNSSKATRPTRFRAPNPRVTGPEWVVRGQTQLRKTRARAAST